MIDRVSVDVAGAHSIAPDELRHTLKSPSGHSVGPLLHRARTPPSHDGHRDALTPSSPSADRPLVAFGCLSNVVTSSLARAVENRIALSRRVGYLAWSLPASTDTFGL